MLRLMEKYLQFNQQKGCKIDIRINKFLEMPRNHPESFCEGTKLFIRETSEKQRSAENI